MVCIRIRVSLYVYLCMCICARECVCVCGIYWMSQENFRVLQHLKFVLTMEREIEMEKLYFSCSGVCQRIRTNGFFRVAYLWFFYFFFSFYIPFFFSFFSFQNLFKIEISNLFRWILRYFI